jgi:hypothetical protein
MSAMDLKGIAWVGNIYNKFEAMCLEVEETMYQDTAKYVESQVQTVGASVKRFYSDVMQDLLPPSCTDPEKVGDTDYSLNACADIETHKKSMSFIRKDNSIVDDLSTEGCKKDSENLNRFQENKSYRRSNAGIKRISKRDNYSLSDKSTSKNLKIDNRSVARDEITVSNSKEEEKKCNAITEANAPLKDYRYDLNPLEDSGENKETRLTDVNSNETCTNRELVSQSETNSDHSGDEEVIISHSDLVEDDNAKEPILKETKEEKSKLEETCVLVDGERLSFISQTQAKNQSYKKKFRKAFLLKLGSGRKQEYEQLTAQYREAAAAPLSTELRTANPSPSELEWELL